MKRFLFIALTLVAGLSIEVDAQQVKVDNVYYSIGDDPKYGKVAVIDSCRKKAHLGLELLLPTEVEIGGRNYPLKDVRNLNNLSANMLIIPGSVETIKENAFAGSTVKEISISNSVTSIEERAFCNMKYLSSIKIPNSVKYLGDELFANSMRLTNVTLPKEVEHIGEGLFMECENIHDVIFPINMRELPPRTFYACRRILNLESFKMQGAVRIGESAFENSGLMAIKVPPTVKEIGDKAFKGCGKLISAIMPERLKSIGSEAFADCPDLNLVQFKGESPVQVEEDTFARSKNEQKHISRAAKSSAATKSSSAGKSAVAGAIAAGRSAAQRTSQGRNLQNKLSQLGRSLQQNKGGQQKRTLQQGSKTGSTTRSTSGSKAGSKSAIGTYTAAQVAAVMNFRGPLIEYIGKPVEECYAGKLEGSWTFPPHTKTESAQNKWNDERIARKEGDETLSNARLVREIKAGKEWIEGQDKIGGPVREFMYSIPNRLDEELFLRAKAISDYVQAYLQLLDSDGETERTLSIRMDRLAATLKKPVYLRAIATSMEPLRSYLTDEALEFIESRGGLAEAHRMERLSWPGGVK